MLLYHIERFPGIVILTTNLIDNIDKAFFRRLKFVLLFDVPPRSLRVKLWKVMYFESELVFPVFSEINVNTKNFVADTAS